MSTDSAILLVNLGTPDSLKISSLRRYLREFLSDRRVINLPFIGRFLLVNCIIAPFRPFKIRHNYAKIWQDGQSPLTLFTKNLSSALHASFQGKVKVDYAMRYGQPSINKRVQELAASGHRNIFIIPLYPQYASATVGSVHEEVMRRFSKLWHVPNVQFIFPYYADPLFIESQATEAKKFLHKEFDGYLFSYHSLPKNHLQIGESGGNHCMATKDCCSQITSVNGFCYRAQCLATTESIRTFLNLPKEKIYTSFQSRLGMKEWIKPYTTDMMSLLPKQGVKRLLVFSPSFVTDCVETLEEIGHTEKNNFIAAGGSSFDLVPCVNASPLWVENLKALIEKQWQKT